jgi:tuftelin-interacting protein 11
VTSAKKDEPTKQEESNENPIEISDSDSDDDDSEAEEKRARPPVVRDLSEEDEDEDDQPRGLGIGANTGRSGFGGAGIGAGIGARKTGGGIGSGAASSGNARRTPTFAASASSTFALSDTPMQTSTTYDERNPQSAPSTDDAPLDMLSGIGTASRARLEEVEEDALHPKDDAHAYPQGFGRQPRRQPESNVQSRANSRGSTPGTGGGIGSNRQRAFAALAPTSTASASQPRPDVTDKDLRHLTSIANTFGARMLAKSGWVPGKGLGADESGKAVPIEANVGLQRGQGIGKGVRTEQSRRDARARGEVFSSDEEAERRKARKAKNRDAGAGKGQEQSKGESASWKKQRKVRVKVEHKTYEQLIAEAGEGPMADSGVGLVLDARGGEVSFPYCRSSIDDDTDLISCACSSKKCRPSQLRRLPLTGPLRVTKRNCPNCDII